MRATYIPLSILVHTRNEGGNIAACLEGLRDWAAEVLVFDMQSTDDTVEKARPLCHQVVSIPFQEEFDAARNISGAAASQPWVLMLDADERLTPTVKATIEELIALDDSEVGAYQLPFRTISFGTWIQHAGGWWPSYKSPPLLRKGRFHFPGHVHGPAIVDGKVVRVTPKNEDDAILHYSHPDLTHYFEKLNRYTTLEGKRRGGTSNWEEVAKGFGQTFAWYFDETEGYRDGLAGFLLAFSSGI